MSDLYNPKTDDLLYDDLYKVDIVQNKDGLVCLIPPTFEELQKIYPSNAGSVISGKGTFGAFKSNLQKAIRRCLENQAIYSVVESTSLSGFFISNIVNRLCKVIISEDIGVAEPLLVLDVIPFYKQFNKNKKEYIGEVGKFVLPDNIKTDLLKLTQKFANCRKSRLVCNLLCYHSRNLSSLKVISFSETFDEFANSLFYNDIDKCVQSILLCLKYATSNYTFKIGKKGFKHESYRLWEYILLISEDLLYTINYDLFELYKHNDDESSLLLIHAALNYIFYNGDNMKLLKKYSMLEEKGPTWEEISKWDNIHIMSVSYDKHVFGIKSLLPERADSKFFWKYGAKIANRNPLIEKYDDYYYSKLID
jgi:hypothetical protein